MSVFTRGTRNLINAAFRIYIHRIVAGFIRHQLQNLLCVPTSQILTFNEFEQVSEARCFQILLTILWWKGLQFRHVSKNPKTFLRTGWNWKLSVQSLGIMIPITHKEFWEGISQLFVISLVPTALGLICQLFCTVRRENSYLPKRMAWADLVDLPNWSH